MRRRFGIWAICAALSLASGPAAIAQERRAEGLGQAASSADASDPGRVTYVAVLAGTWHIGNDELNNATPGITLGQRGPLDWPEVGLDWPGLEWHLEGGAFYNSYYEISPILLGGLSADLGTLGKGQIRVGASVGTAYYRELSVTLKERYDLPNIGGFIPMAALTGAYRLGGTDIRLTMVPPGRDSIAIINLSLAQRF